MLTRFLIILALSTATLLTSTVFAAPIAAEDWTSIRAEYDQLKTYMSSKRRIGASERTALQGLQSRLDAYLGEYPEDRRAIALDINVASWLGQTERVDADYERLAMLSDADAVWLAWAERHLAENRYGDAGDLARGREYDLAKTPGIAILNARVHMSNNEFADAIVAIDAIPEEGLAKPGIRTKANRIRGQAQRWLALWTDELALRTAEESAGTAPIMQLITSRGPVTILLHEDQAPNTVANFIELSERGFYNGTRFHRVEPNFVAQGGDPNSRLGSVGTAGTGGRGAQLPDESARSDKRRHFAGVLAMAKAPDPSKPGKSIPNSGSSQFYIVLEPAESLNAEYTVFGRVIDGMEAVHRLRRNDELTAVTTISKPDRQYKATTIPLPGIPAAGTPLDKP
jgi:peptidyl-prolyl cis-trans isomerase B (cyclophilin B)